MNCNAPGMKDAGFWIEKLELNQHPEGGWFREIYRSEELIETDFGKRNISTSIYYLLEGKDFSAFHRIRSDEIWHFYTGSSAIEILCIEKGELRKYFLGNNVLNQESFQVLVPKNCWFAARLTDINGYALAGCTVAPGFHFEDFEMANQSLRQEFPALTTEIEILIRS